MAESAGSSVIVVAPATGPHTSPTATSHHAVVAARTSPARAATPKAAKAATFTARGVAAPEPTRRIGPTRSASVPRMPSE